MEEENKVVPEEVVEAPQEEMSCPEVLPEEKKEEEKKEDLAVEVEEDASANDNIS